MNQETLRELLARLHERLSQPGSVDGEARELLGTVMRDIERALGRRTQLESLAVQFEADHPQLAELLRRIIDALGKAGI